MKAVGERGYRVVHPEGMGVFDRAAHFGEQSVDRRGELGQAIAHDPRRWTCKIALLDREEPIAER